MIRVCRLFPVCAVAAIPAASIREFCKRIGVTKQVTFTIEMASLESAFAKI